MKTDRLNKKQLHELFQTAQELQTIINDLKNSFLDGDRDGFLVGIPCEAVTFRDLKSITLVMLSFLF